MRPPFSLLLVLGLSVVPPAAAQIHAERGSVAIGGNVVDSTVVLGVTQERVDELVRERTRPLELLTGAQRQTIGLLQEKLDLNEKQLRAALEVVGERNVPPNELAARLVEVAQRFREMLNRASAQPGDTPELIQARAAVKTAIENGELGKADELLSTIWDIQQRSAEAHIAGLADTSAERGELALARLRYDEAAAHFAKSAALAATLDGHDDQHIEYLRRQADALFRQGFEFGDNDAALRAIDAQRAIADLTPRESVPLDWATVQNNLGVALTRLGERESGTARLDEAVGAFRNALTEFTRERAPLDWTETQTNLGGALWTLGQRESGTVRLEEAVSAFREALKELTRERAPLRWAEAQINLGVALGTLGLRESRTVRLEEAVSALREGLEELTRERVPLQWAAIQNNLGTVLSALGERESGTQRLDEAIVAFHDALKEFTHERAPLQWAMTQNNLGGALWTLGARESSTARMEDAVAAYRGALPVFESGGADYYANMARDNLARAEQLLAERRGP